MTQWPLRSLQVSDSSDGLRQARHRTQSRPNTNPGMLAGQLGGGASLSGITIKAAKKDKAEPVTALLATWGPPVTEVNRQKSARNISENI